MLGLQEAGDGAGGEEAGLGANYDLVALQLAQRRADAAFRPLVAIVDGGVEQVDAALTSRDQGLGVGLVGRIVVGAQVGADTQAGYLQAENGAIERGVAVLREAVDVAGGAFGGSVHVACLAGADALSVAPYSLTAFDSIRALISLRQSAIDFAPWSACLRLRTATMPFSCSRSPTTSMYGIFCSWASRIFRFTFSLRSSTVARIPASSSCLRMSWA